ncbi:hypothetical protein OA40_11410 [Morganella morganii]|uniref:hypothetical protein n=1 Tax=Morganella morganii TaxID=582 RepID=UPI0005FAD0C0|nr:hypothetical protein [Morganella morganii]ELA9132453.1 hypothetical protein [Morganella morganii]EMD6373991.1 hypothetical protein [Morganella morganii]KJY05078.1 hypothetical protein Mm0Y_01551 [Morganella morganii]KKY66070.1 hypothetical protein OA40_11410 [Morganella morganii]MBS9540507.1 hypothetical protein [Morganella morganii subsp. morganii]
MKTSTLIAKLQQIDKTVPFDADVVTGDDWQFLDIARVYHNPPHTFIEFKDIEDLGNDDNDTDEAKRNEAYDEISARAGMLEQVIGMIKQNPDAPRQQILSELELFLSKLNEMMKAL